ncbi:uncharacterized protein TNCV_263251 [Trichonephila clavipes]|nr:uncharacterized protein TNCV_263251 [Trichonephila clavipes]
MLERRTCTLHCCRNGSDCVEAAKGDQQCSLKLPDDWAYHHHLSTIFFVESSAVPVQIAIRAMTFFQDTTLGRKHFAEWAFSKMEQDPTWGFNILWTDEAHFRFLGDVNNHNCRIATSNSREYTQKPLHSPKK